MSQVFWDIQFQRFFFLKFFSAPYAMPLRSNRTVTGDHFGPIRDTTDGSGQRFEKKDPLYSKPYS